MTETQKANKRIYQRAYRAMFPGRVRESMRVWRETHRNEVRLYNINYRKANPSIVKAATQGWRDGNKDKVKSYNQVYFNQHPEKYKTWKKRHPDRIREYSRAYLKTHLEQFKVRNHKRRALIRGNGGHYTAGEWELLKAEYGYRCPKCGRPEPEIKLTVDHIIPIAKGGTNFIENIQPLCLKCNSEKHTKVIAFTPIKETP